MQFSEGNKTMFCSNDCQTWLNEFIQFTLDCPHDCDEWKSDNDYENICDYHWNSVQQLELLAVTQCNNTQWYNMH